MVRVARRPLGRHATRYDIIQVCELPNFVYWLKKRGAPTPVVMRLTAPNYHDPRGGVPLADALIASGTSIARLRECGHINVQNIPNAVDADHFKPQPSAFRETLNIPRDAFVVLYVARFQAFKNHALLLNAFAALAKDRPASHLLLVGSGPLRAAIEKQAADLGLTPRVHFLGEIPFQDLPAIYAAADVHAISSDYESFCFAAIEAMSTGLPILTTDCGWVPNLVADDAGIITPVGDPAAFAAALKKLADNPALRHRLGATGRALVLDRHTWPASAEKPRSVPLPHPNRPFNHNAPQTAPSATKHTCPISARAYPATS